MEQRIALDPGLPSRPPCPTPGQGLGKLDPLEQRAFFIGAGIRRKDDNLKYLLGAASKF